MTINRIKTWVSNEALNDTDLNAEFDNILNNQNIMSDGPFTFSQRKTFDTTPRLQTQQTNSNNVNALDLVTKNYVDDNAGVSTQKTGPVSYTNATTVTVPFIHCSNSTNTVWIKKATSTTCNIANLGVGGISNTGSGSTPAGTITVTTGTATVTGTASNFTLVFQPGDVIRTASGQARRILTVSSNTSLTVESNWTTTETAVTWGWGGRAPNTWYHLYAISNPSGITDLMFSHNPNGLTLSGGYTSQRLLPFSIRTDSSSNLLPFLVTDWYTGTPLIHFRDSIEGATYNVVSAGSGGGWGTVSCGVAGANLIPVTSGTGYFNYQQLAGGGAVNNAYYRPTGGSGNVSLGTPINTSGVVHANQVLIPLNSSLQFDYFTNGVTGARITVMGYKVDLVK